MLTKRNLIMCAVLIALGVMGRMLPHLWNMTPLIAITLFAGVYLGRHNAIIVPVVTMLISDIFIGFYDLRVAVAVYISFAIAGIIGYIFARSKKVNTLIISAFSASTLFFLITNAAVWAFGTMYSPGFEGLIQSYIAGLPFYRNMMLGDVFYTLALFGAYEFSVSLVKKYRVAVQ